MYKHLLQVDLKHFQTKKNNFNAIMQLSFLFLYSSIFLILEVRAQ